MWAAIGLGFFFLGGVLFLGDAMAGVGLMMLMGFGVIQSEPPPTWLWEVLGGSFLCLCFSVFSVVAQIVADRLREIANDQ